jgi:hypothetical protein
MPTKLADATDTCDWCIGTESTDEGTKFEGELESKESFFSADFEGIDAEPTTRFPEYDNRLRGKTTRRKGSAKHP